MSESTTHHPLLERLSHGPLLADGGMGTMLYERGVSFEHCFDELNLSRRDLVRSLHEDYIASGARLITTNTFGGNRVRLARHGFEDKVRDVNFAGAKLAREAREIVGSDALVMGSIGPLGQRLAPLGSVTIREAQEIFSQQAAALLEGGVDLFIFETMSDLDEITAAVHAVRELTRDVPIIASMTFTDAGTTLTGKSPREVVVHLQGLAVDVIGANCSVGPQGMLEVLHRMSAVATRPLAAMPNAGMPQLVDGRFVYTAGPEYFASFVGPFLASGARIIGGCCGTTPQHIAAMAQALRHWETRSRDTAPHVSIAISERDEPPEPQRDHRRSGFCSNLRRRFQISVELDPPKGTNPRKVIEGARLCLSRGADAVNIGDSPMARVRMSAIATAALIEREVGIETILHFCCRDRNLMGIQSDLIGAHALGVRNVLAITGDPPSVGDYPHITGVYDVDSIGLVRILQAMNEGADFAGASIGHATDFCIGVALNPVADDLESEIKRFRRKVEAGAHYAFTQPLYRIEPLQRCLDAIGDVRIPIFLGLLPLMSFRHANFMHHEVPGVVVPEEDLRSIEKAGDRGAELGIEICRSLLETARSLVDGVYLMPSFGRYETCLRVIEGFVEPNAVPDEIIEDRIRA